MRFAVFFLMFALFLTGAAQFQVMAEDENNEEAIRSMNQNPKDDPENGDQEPEEAFVKTITPEDIEKSMFSATKSGCRSKMQYFMVQLIQYEKGVAVKDYSPMKFMEEIFQKSYDQIKVVGVTQAMHNAMKEYQTCVDTATPETAAEREEKELAFYNTCGGLNALGLFALDGLKKEKKQEQVEAEAKDMKLNLTGTVMKDMEAPEIYVISKVYAAGKESFDKAVKEAYGLTTFCFATKR